MIVSEPQEHAAHETAADFELVIPPPRNLTLGEELALYRAAWEKQPDVRLLRLRFARLLLSKDQFTEAAGLLASWAVDEYPFLMLEAEAILSFETEDTNERSCVLCRRALELASQDDQRVSTLAVLGKALVRLGKVEEARLCFAESLALDQHERNAYKRQFSLELTHGERQRALALAEEALDRGVTHSRVLSSRLVGLAQLGRVEEARDLQNAHCFLKHLEPEPPEGWASLTEFNRVLAEEMANHPDIRYGRYGVASRETWRIDEPALARAPLFPILQQMLRREIMRYVKELPATGHPFVDHRPRHATMRNWCVITEGEGHETWHVHQHGWLSGTYYIQVPDHIAHGTGSGGCIAFGLPEEQVGEENAACFGRTLCRPYAGLMLLFPSYIYHRTFPHCGMGQRVCCAFDVDATRRAQ